jgi:anti-sigma B factor antagonist
MEIKTLSIGTATVVEIAGDVDAKTVLQAQERLEPLVQPEAKLLLDLSATTYLSSAGLRMLLSLYKQLLSRNGRIVLVRLSDEIKDTMLVTGFLRFFTTCDSVDEGLAALR